ncbi:hypothetical protein ACJJTC_001312 [Scirpophaga incertulas]
MMWWAVWCAMVVAGAAAAPAPAPDSLSNLDLLQIDPPAPDDEGMSYALPNMGGRYAAAPWLYLLAEMPRDSQKLEFRDSRVRAKRKMPSLSINNPMEVLRQRLLLEVARKQMREANQRQAVANRLFLQNVGKRGFWMKTSAERYDN